MSQTPVPPMIGRSEAMGILRERLSLLASSETPALLVGETGTGRTLGARTVHALSGRRGDPFVLVDCATISGVGPDGSRAWARDAIAQAPGGVLFLRNAERLDAAAQGQILDALPGASGVRLLATSTPGLATAAEEGRFAPELLRLLSAEVVVVPPLRERGGDVFPIARHFIETIRRMNELPPIQLSPAALAVMEKYSWPGNVGELREVVERAITVATQGILQPEHLPEAVRRVAMAGEEGGTGRSPRRFREAKRRVVDSFERSYLEELLAWHRGNVTAAAAQAGMLRSALQRLLRKHELRSSDFRKGSRGQVAARREHS